MCTGQSFGLIHTKNTHSDSAADVRCHLALICLARFMIDIAGDTLQAPNCHPQPANLATMTHMHKQAHTHSFDSNNFILFQSISRPFISPMFFS